MEIREAWRSLQRWLGRHPIAADAVATGFDVIGAVGGVIGACLVFPASFTPLGAAAFVGSVSTAIGSVVLLAADGRDGYLRIRGEMAAISGYEKSATRYALKTARWERTAYYRRTELLAPLLTLPGIATDSIGAATDIARADTAAVHASRVATDASRASDVATQNLSKSDMYWSKLFGYAQDYNRKGMSPAGRRDILAHIGKMQSDPVARMPRAALKFDVEKTAKALKAALAEKAAAEREAQMAWANAMVLPKMQKLDNPFLGLSRVPVLPPSVDYGGLGTVGLLMPGVLDTVSSPLPGGAGLDVRHRPPEVVSFSMFVSTRSGQPGN